MKDELDIDELAAKIAYKLFDAFLTFFCWAAIGSGIGWTIFHLAGCGRAK